MSETPDEEVPAFPIRTVAVGIAIMLAMAAASAAISWVVGSRVRTIANSQLSVITAAEQLERQSEQLELLARLGVATAEPEYAERHREVQPRIGRTLAALERAIRLKSNRAAFVEVSRVAGEISALEVRALALADAGRRAEGRAMLATPRYRTLLASYRSGVGAIERRSRAYIDATRRDANRYLSINFAANIVVFMLILVAWFVLVRPARRWAAELGEARARAESATRAKSDFLAVMSHEIRTPLNSIIGFADMLRTDPALGPTQRHQVELMQGAGTMLLTVVNDLLDFSKIEAGRIELHEEPFALETLVDNSVSIVRGAAEAKGLEMRVEIDPCLPPFYRGDENRLRQVLLNLLNNAVKFTPAGLISLCVSGQGSGEGSERIRFTVTDTGVGIDPERQQMLFQPFAQADASITRRFGGTGLGLSISRRLVELMGGEIGFESQPGAGSTFWFALDLPRAERPDLLDEAAPAPVAGGARILVAEDLPMNQELARAMLGRAGHRVEIAPDGAAALRLAAQGGWDLVLMDIQMPVMDGITATRGIRALPPPEGAVPILAMTANVLPEQVAEFLGAGMDGHIAKPVRQHELHAAVARALDGRPRVAAPQAAAAEEEAAFDAATFESVREMLPPERLAGYADALAAEAARLAEAAPGDASAIETAAHRIVSQAGMLGLPRLSARARALEEAARAGEGVAEALARFREAAGDTAHLRTDG